MNCESLNIQGRLHTGVYTVVENHLLTREQRNAKKIGKTDIFIIEIM